MDLCFNCSDHSGGSTVNLVPFEKPQDVYSVVLKQVRETIERDSIVPDGEEPSDINIIAQHLKGKMNRKVRFAGHTLFWKRSRPSWSI